MMKKHILVLDDDQNIFFIVRTLLSKLQCKVTWSRTGHEAMAKVKSGTYDLIVVDYRLPDCDGLTWISELRAAGYETALVFLSGIGVNYQNQMKLRNLFNVEAVIQKPVEPGEFVKAVSAVLSQHDGTFESTENEPVFDPFESAFNANPLESACEDSPPDKETSVETEPFDLEGCLQDLSGEAPAELTHSSDEYDDEFEEELYQLKLSYLEDLPTLLRELAEKLENAEKSSWSKDLVYDALLIAHNIKGTSASLSIDLLPEIFASIESALEDVHEKSSIEPATDPIVTVQSL